MLDQLTRLAVTINVLPMAKQAAIIRALCDGVSIRATSRMTGTSKTTVLKLLADFGMFCSIYQYHALRNLPCKRVQADEIWSFVGAKEANKTNGQQGDIWTYIALCADTKLAITWLVGSRTTEVTRAFIADLAPRFKNRIQLSTDNFTFYRPAVEEAFGWNGCDFGTVTKVFGSETPEVRGRGRQAPSPVVIGVQKSAIMGNPDPDHISTSYIERQNLSLRTTQRRFSRLTISFSKKAENHAHAVSANFMIHNYCRAHITLTKAAGGIKTTPAMAAGLTDHVWTVEEILEMIDPARLLQ